MKLFNFNFYSQEFYYLLELMVLDEMKEQKLDQSRAEEENSSPLPMVAENYVKKALEK